MNGFQLIVRKLVFTANASVVTITSSPSYLAPNLSQFANHEFSNLSTLTILLADQSANPGHSAIPSIALASANEAVRKVITKHQERGGPSLELLRISRALLEDDESWFAERIVTLEILDSVTFSD